MKISGIRLEFTATRRAGGVRFRCAGLGHNEVPESLLYSWRTGADGRTNRKGRGSGSSFEIDIQVGGESSAAWAIVDLRQSIHSIEEHFGLVLMPQAPTEKITVALEPLPTDLSALCYTASHEDLIEALGTDPDAARNHYKSHGLMEGRSVTFRPYEYAASHTDLFTLVNDPKQSAQHYISSGHAERRPIYFDAYLYGAGYPDLAEQFGTDVGALAKHYVEHGFAEGRHCDNFDWQSYISQNAQAPRSRVEAALHYLSSKNK